MESSKELGEIEQPGLPSEEAAVAVTAPRVMPVEEVFEGASSTGRSFDFPPQHPGECLRSCTVCIGGATRYLRAAFATDLGRKPGLYVATTPIRERCGVCSATADNRAVDRAHSLSDRGRGAKVYGETMGRGGRGRQETEDFLIKDDTSRIASATHVAAISDQWLFYNIDDFS